MVIASLLALAVSGSLNAGWGPPPPVAPHVKTPLTNVKAVRPMIFPVIGKVRMVNGYNEERATHRHPGMDIVAPKMTPIVAPFSGTLGMKVNSFWIWADDGWGFLGTHLNNDNIGTADNKGSRDVMFAPDLVPGQRVEAGRLIGYVGDSGNATGPHLHMELFAPGGRVGNTRGKLRNPEPSLHMAQRISAPRVTIPAADQRPSKGEQRLVGCVRKVIPGAEGRPGELTLLLTAKQDAKGRATAISKVRYLKVRVTEATVDGIGGWETLAEAPEHATVGVYVTASGRPDNALVRRITAPTPSR